MTAAAAVPAPPEPPPGVFTPDNEWVIPLEVDILAEEYPSEFWSQWEKTELKLSMEPWISPDKLRETAKEIGFPNLDYVEEMAVMLEEGARTGVEGAARLPSSGPNNPNLRNVAPQVLDTLRTWCRQGLVCGPLEDSEVPAGAKSSPLSGVLKPSGKARIINNQSWPHLDNPDLEGDEAVSFNAGIQSDLFPTIQITSKHLLKRLTEVGEGAYASKVDMSDAYKHIPVHPLDVLLQCLRLGGRWFVERCLTFGSSSSPGLFDRLAELILLMSLWILAWSRAMACRQLDDAILIARKAQVMEWYRVYTGLCNKLGVRLAPEQDGKAFACEQEGVLLGIHFNLRDWTWGLEDKKAEKILRLLAMITGSDTITLKDLAKLNGKISFYMDLVGGRWERAFLLAPGTPDRFNGHKEVPITPGMKSQASWWHRRVVVAMSHPDRIPDYRLLRPVPSVHIFPDAAGGLGAAGSGFGAAVWTWPRSYVAHFWPAAIRNNTPVEGEQLANKMMFLESVAILAGVVAAPDKVRGQAIMAHCDNSAAVCGFRKRHSKELLAYSALKAANTVAEGLGATLTVGKIKRVSCVGALVADLLSKGDVEQALYYMENAEPEPGFISRTMLRWLESPEPTRVLGEAILLELRAMDVPVMINFVVTEEISNLVWRKS